MPCAQRSVNVARMPMGRKHRPYQKIPTSTESFGYALRLARVKKKWSIMEAAAKVRVTPARLARIEGQTVRASNHELAKLSALFPMELELYTHAPNS